MPFVGDSRTPGFLGPNPSPHPLDDENWEDFLHDVIAGVTGLDPTLVRPRWQLEPPNMPDFHTDWVAFGVTDTQIDFAPAIIHIDEGEGRDLLQEHEMDTVLCSFYGPNAMRYCSYLRRGLFIWQNRAMLRANAVGLVEVGTFTHAPELIREQWHNRIDTSVVMRREIRYDYNVRNIVRAQVDMNTNPPGETRILNRDIDTGFVPED
jgi:hypothetical protein